jgi:signal transduction histidine kinase
LPAHWLAELESGVPTAMVLSWFVSNSFQALLGAIFIHSFSGTNPRLHRINNLITFLIFGAFLAPFVASFLDTTLVRLNGLQTAQSYWELWQLRFLSNVLASLILVPFVLEWAQADIKLLTQTSWSRYLEAVLLLAGLFGVGYLVFNSQSTTFINESSRLYWPLPFLVWATVRFGVRGVSSVLLIVMFMAITGATDGSGPFTAGSAARNALSIQVFLIVVSGTLLALAAIIEERQLTEQTLAETNARNQAILRAIPDMMFLQDKDGVYIDFYTRDPSTLLVPPQEFLGKSTSEVLPLKLAERLNEVFEKLKENDPPQVLEYSLPFGDEERHFEARLVKAKGLNVLSIVRDVTDAYLAAEALRKSEERLSLSTRQIRSLAGRLITAQESERRRISMLLHDDVGQNVAALGLAISRLKRRCLTAPESVVAELDELANQTGMLMTQIRQLSHQLHPEVLEHLGLIKALEAHVAELDNEQRIAVRFSTNIRTEPIPTDIAVCLYRVALEALRNVSIHSGASAANVALEENEGWLVLKVSDSGNGFDVEKLRVGTGLGLASSEERVKLLNGSLEIISESQMGTRLTARVPIQRNQ